MPQRTNIFTRFFLAALLLIFIEGFLLENGNIFFALLGLAGILYAVKKQKRAIFWISVGLIVIVFMSMWSMRIIIVLVLAYIIWKMVQKEPLEVDVSAYQTNAVKQNNPIISFEQSSTATYQWQDVHIQNAAGDLIVDTTTTILPKNVSLINVRQGFGKTTVYVPYEVPVRIHFNTLYGEVQAFGNQYSRLFNQSIVLKDGDFIDTPQQLIITVSTFLGDLEVVRK